MTIDMSQFNAAFLEEATEHLSDLENALLQAEESGDTDVDAIFRAAHSIKGGAGTFGFIEIAEFTHFVEHILQEARDGVTKLSSDVVTTLLKSVDVLTDMIDAAKEDREIGDVGQDLVIKELKALSNDAEDTAAHENIRKTEPTDMKLIEIKFKPNADMAMTGSDPSNIFKELSELGDLTTTAHIETLPSLEELEPHSIYLSWTLHLETEATEEAVREAFIFVEDESDISIEVFAAVEQEKEPSDDTIKADTDTNSNTSQNSAAEDVLHATPMQDRRAPETDRRTQDRRKKEPAKEQNSFIRVSVDKVDSLINLVGELVTSNAMVIQQTGGQQLSEENQALQEALTQMSSHTRLLQEGIMAIRMMPIDFAFSRFPRMVRDTAKKLGKEVNLETIGGNTELDKTVIEKITDPLTHLVRNAIDHGIEDIAGRQAAGKPTEGTVCLKAYYKGGNVMIEIKDDGKGLDRERILSKAIEKGLANADQNYTDDEIYQFIFSSGFSTAATVSDVSGRGVGMDVVYRNIKGLGGSIHIESKPGQGSCFTIGLPLTLAIVDGMAISMGEETYIIPLLNILESIKPSAEQIQKMKNNVEIINVRGKYLPLLRLNQALPVELEPSKRADEDSIAIIVESEYTQVAILVDELIGERQVVIKNLEDNYKEIEGISGATILGDGRIALIIDLAGLIRISQRDGTYASKMKSTYTTNPSTAEREEMNHE